MKKKWLILSVFVIGFLLYFTKPNEAIPADITYLGYVEGQWTVAPNGGAYCAGTGICCFIYADGMKMWINPNLRDGQTGPEKIVITQEQLDKLNQGEVVDFTAN